MEWLLDCAVGGGGWDLSPGGGWRSHLCGRVMRDHPGRTGARDRWGRVCRRHPAGAAGAEVVLTVMDEVHGGPLAPVLLGAAAEGAADGRVLVADNRLGLSCHGFRGIPATSLRPRTAWPPVSRAARPCRSPPRRRSNTARGRVHDENNGPLGRLPSLSDDGHEVGHPLRNRLAVDDLAVLPELACTRSRSAASVSVDPRPRSTRAPVVSVTESGLHRGSRGGYLTGIVTLSDVRMAERGGAGRAGRGWSYPRLPLRPPSLPTTLPTWTPGKDFNSEVAALAVRTRRAAPSPRAPCFAGGQCCSTRTVRPRCSRCNQLWFEREVFCFGVMREGDIYVKKRHNLRENVVQWGTFAKLLMRY